MSPFNNDPLTLDEVIKAITILVAMIGVNMANKKISPVLLVWITKGDSAWVYYFRLTLIVSIVTLCSHFMVKYSKLYFGGDTYVGYTIVMVILMFVLPALWWWFRSTLALLTTVLLLLCYTTGHFILTRVLESNKGRY